MKIVSIVVLTLAILGTGSATAADPFPHRKPGLWQVTLTMDALRTGPMVSKYCIDAATEAALFGMGRDTMKNLCSKQDIHFAGGKGTIDTVCKIGKSTQTAHTDIAFQGDSAYHSQTRSHSDPALFGKADRVNTTDARWLGACPPNMKPGDMLLPNGMTTHLGATLH